MINKRKNCRVQQNIKGKFVRMETTMNIHREVRNLVQIY